MIETVKEVEKLQEEEKPVTTVENDEEIVVDNAEEEVKAEEKPESVEDKEEEEVKEEIVEVDEKAEIKEAIETTKEELAVIKEVRDELVELYANYSNIEKTKEQLSKDNKVLNEKVEKLESELHIYKEAGEKLALKEKQERLEKLSAKFKALGQEKSVEQLSTKDSETLEEFEKIVDAALDRTNDVVEMPSVTAPSQGECLSDKESDEKPSEEGVKTEESKKEEKLANSNAIFESICRTLTKEQMISGKRKPTFM